MSFERIYFLIPNIFFWIFFIFEISTHVKYFRFFLKRKNESPKDYGVVDTDSWYLLEGGEVVRTLRLCAYQETIYTQPHARPSGASQLTLVSFPLHGRTFAARCIFIRRCNRRCTRISTMWTTAAYYDHLSAARMALSVKNRLEAIVAVRGFLRCGLLQLPFKT